MSRLLDDLNAFFQEHRRCGELDSGADGRQVWMTCACGARIIRPLRRAVSGVDQ
jgi:hypothetical protein